MEREVRRPTLGFSEFAKRVLFVGFVIIAVLAAWTLKSLLLLAFAGALLALILHTLAAPLAKRLPFGVTTTIVAILILTVVVLGGAGMALGSQIATELTQLWQRLPDLIDMARSLLGEGELARSAVRLFDRAGEAVNASGALKAAAVTFNAVFDIVLVLVVGVIFALNPQLYIDGLVRLVPPGYRQDAREVLQANGKDLRQWLMAQFTLMVAVGVMTWIGLTLLGVPLALGLAFLAFLLEFIPVIGPIAAALPAVLLALSVSPTLALWTALLYVAIQQIESYALMPVLQRWAVRIPPALTLLAIAAFGILFGWVGVILATPLLVTTIVWVKKVYVERILKDASAAGP